MQKLFESELIIQSNTSYILRFTQEVIYNKTLQQRSFTPKTNRESELKWTTQLGLGKTGDCVYEVNICILYF